MKPHEASSDVVDDDPTRATAPTSAVSGGADRIVVGRPNTRAGDPVEVAERIALEIERGASG